VLESPPVSEENILILASNSPRRRQLLSLGGWTYNIAVADVDESLLPDEAPGDYVLRLAESKALKSAENAHPDNVVIAADTAVVDCGDILGKPLDEGDAARMLKRLRGHTHQVYTGLALLRVSDNHTLIDLSVTDVPMRDYSDEEINAYIQTGDPLDKAGAYAIQHPDFHPVENLEGCYASVMGLPLCHLTRALGRLGLALPVNVPRVCQDFTGHRCSIAKGILQAAIHS